ncbi:MAG TPA: hypothetical protein VKU89_04415 [Solirubrobacteraceae bacterium]|nr:hypothetical protein [Solirubrobacteraceae bacterium]
MSSATTCSAVAAEGTGSKQPEVSGVAKRRRPRGHHERRPRAAVHCIADDFLPKARPNARRKITDAEIATLRVAQAIMGIRSDPLFLAVAARRLCHLFQLLAERAAAHKHRLHLADQIEALIAHFARQSPASTLSCWS